MQEPNNNLKEHPDLYNRSIKGGCWVFAIKFATQLLGLIKSIIIANCLMLENLGLIAIAVMLMEVLNTLSESGFHAALVQKKENIEDYLDTAWVVGILRGVLLFAAVYFAAPLFVSFKVAPEDIPLAISVIRAMGVCFLISAFQNIGTVHFQKELQFHKTFWMRIAGTLTDIVISITLMLIYRSVWAVVAARLVTAVVNIMMSYLICSYRPRFRFDYSKVKELWGFGKWVFGGGIIGFLISQGGDFFVWFYLGLPHLALYRYAFRFSTMPAAHITHVISSVTFPAYSKIQGDLPRLREAYLKVLKFTAFFSVPISFLIFLLGPDFVYLVLPERMYPMTITLQILAVKGFMASISSTYGPVFRSLGKPQIISYTSSLCLVILAITIYPFTKLWGIAGAAFSTVLFGVLVNPLCFLLMCRILRCTAWKMLQQILYPLGASISMVLVLTTVRVLFSEKPTYTSFFILGIIGVVSYLAIIGLLDRFFNYGIRQLLLEQFYSIKRKTEI